MSQTYLFNVRTVINNDGKREKVCIAWVAGSQSQKHDHGASMITDDYPGSCGVTTVLEGSIYEIRDGVRKDYEVGEQLFEFPDTIHIVGSETGAITLHVYTPPLTGHLTIIP